MKHMLVLKLPPFFLCHSLIIPHDSPDKFSLMFGKKILTSTFHILHEQNTIYFSIAKEVVQPMKVVKMVSVVTRKCA